MIKFIRHKQNHQLPQQQIKEHQQQQQHFNLLQQENQQKLVYNHHHHHQTAKNFFKKKVVLQFQLNNENKTKIFFNKLKKFNIKIKHIFLCTTTSRMHLLSVYVCVNVCVYLFVF